jgi:hypothetical protein
MLFRFNLGCGLLNLGWFTMHRDLFPGFQGLAFFPVQVLFSDYSIQQTAAPHSDGRAPPSHPLGHNQNSTGQSPERQPVRVTETGNHVAWNIENVPEGSPSNSSDSPNSRWSYDLKCRRNPCARYTVPRYDASRDDCWFTEISFCLWWVHVRQHVFCWGLL